MRSLLTVFLGLFLVSFLVGCGNEDYDVSFAGSGDGGSGVPDSPSKVPSEFGATLTKTGLTTKVYEGTLRYDGVTALNYDKFFSELDSGFTGTKPEKVNNAKGAKATRTGDVNATLSRITLEANATSSTPELNDAHFKLVFGTMPIGTGRGLAKFAETYGGDVNSTFNDYNVSLSSSNGFTCTGSATIICSKPAINPKYKWTGNKTAQTSTWEITPQ
ncbi:hypothetical protein AGMMS50229_15440 [Campylobacterota bacterium]|nr:hypothetical protein AGMMS50229_15440 [Campylobacterota bacterium]